MVSAARSGQSSPTIDKRYSMGICMGAAMYDLPGGKVEVLEHPAVAAHRKLEEELICYPMELRDMVAAALESRQFGDGVAKFV